MFNGIEFNVPFKLLNLIVNKCQYAINKMQCLQLDLNLNNQDVKKISKEINLTTLEYQLNLFIKGESNNLPSALVGINLNSNSESISDSCKDLIKENLWPSIQYYNRMITRLETCGFKTFDLLPIQNLGMSHVRLGSRFLVTIYNEYYDTKIKIKDFESNYEKYYKEMFNLNYFKNRKDLEDRIPVSFLTDGISVSCMFRTLKTPNNQIPKIENPVKKINLK